MPLSNVLSSAAHPAHLSRKVLFRLGAVPVRLHLRTSLRVFLKALLPFPPSDVLAHFSLAFPPSQCSCDPPRHPVVASLSVSFSHPLFLNVATVSYSLFPLAAPSSFQPQSSRYCSNALCFLFHQDWSVPPLYALPTFLKARSPSPMVFPGSPFLDIPFSTLSRFFPQLMTVLPSREDFPSFAWLLHSFFIPYRSRPHFVSFSDTSFS